MTELSDVKDFWNKASCGEVYAGEGDERQRYANVSRLRYELEPYLLTFAEFDKVNGKDFWK